MTTWSVNLVTAFGRGAQLALTLMEQGFSVRVLDFTEAFAETFDRGVGPFPVAAAPNQLPPEAPLLPRGLALWLKEGPIELGGPLAEFYSHRPDVKALRGNTPVEPYATDWLRRFMRQWASPFAVEAWDVDESDAAFPTNVDLYRLPTKHNSFDRLVRRGLPVVNAQKLVSLRLVGSRLTEIVVESGQAMAFGAEQWIWELSGQETEHLNAELAQTLFPRGLAAATWAWVSFKVRAAHGPWMEGLPAEFVLIGDTCLPLDRENAAVFSREDRDLFAAWMKVPRALLENNERKENLLNALQSLLMERLSLAKWAVDPSSYKVSPHAPIFSTLERRQLDPRWRNWDWIAAENLPRLDWGARLKRESEAVERLNEWRADQLKKQGAPDDPSLHAL